MSAAQDTIVIPEWANGPDDSGNGGWSAALLAAHVPGSASGGVAVSLRVPPPLGRELQVVHVADEDAATLGRVELRDGEVLVAQGEPADVSLDVPDAVRSITVDAARAAQARFPFRDEHPFPRCISCGIARAAGEPSLHVHAGQVDGVSLRGGEAGDALPVFASTWLPTAAVADPDDPSVASRAACWSALDCPSAAPMADPHAVNPSVLARIAVRLASTGRVRIGEPHVLAAWQVGRDGRKQWSRSVLLDAQGEVLGAADALWIEVRAR